MTNEMREQAINNIEASQGHLTVEFAKEAIEAKRRGIAFWESRSYAWESRYEIENAEKEIEYFEAVIEVLTEMAEIEIANEAVQAVISEFGKVSKTTLVRKAVARMANSLKKLGYSLSESFKKAWCFIKALVTLPGKPAYAAMAA